MPSVRDLQVDAGQIAVWPRKAFDQVELDRVVGDIEHDRDRRCCTFGRHCYAEARGRDNHRDFPADQIGRQLRQAIDLFGPAVVNRDVLALDITRFLEALTKGAQPLGNCTAARF